LILRKISKFYATRCQILRLKCTKFDFRWGSAPDPVGGSFSSPRPLAVFKGPTSKGRAGQKAGEGQGSEMEGEEKRREGRIKGMGREGPGPQIFWPGTAPVRCHGNTPASDAVCVLAALAYRPKFRGASASM